MIIEVEDGQVVGGGASLSGALASLDTSDHIAVWVHGGLVDRASGLAAADRVGAAITRANASPVAIVWSSDVGSVLRERWPQLASESVFRRVLWHVLRFAASRVLTSGAVRSAGAVASQTEFRFGTLDQMRASAQALATEEGLAPQSRSVGGDDEQALRDAIASDDTLELLISRAQEAAGPSADDAAAKGILSLASLAGQAVRVLHRVVKRFASGRDHGLYTTVLEEASRELLLDRLGGVVWQEMKAKITTALEVGGVDRPGTVLLDFLAAWWIPGRRVTLVGHSAGTVALLALLRAAARHPTLPPELRFDLIFLAAACRFDDAAATLGMADARVGRCRWFGLGDDLEAGYWEIPGVYDKSLLYLVSGLLEDEAATPLVGMARWFEAGRWSPTSDSALSKVRAHLTSPPSGVFWSVHPGPPGEGCDALKHGDFDDDTTTLATLTHLLRQPGWT